ncbi:hypothetical protein [Nostoc sp. TCL26-01]|nr:hypothetical protein [Nostoc sp. TCL26-01]
MNSAMIRDETQVFADHVGCAIRTTNNFDVRNSLSTAGWNPD